MRSSLQTSNGSSKNRLKVQTVRAAAKVPSLPLELSTFHGADQSSLSSFGASIALWLEFCLILLVCGQGTPLSFSADTDYQAKLEPQRDRGSQTRTGAPKIASKCKQFERQRRDLRCRSNCLHFEGVFGATVRVLEPRSRSGSSFA